MFAEFDLLADPDEPRDLNGMLPRCEMKLKVA
jgi:ornithine cyclodeaminase